MRVEDMPYVLIMKVGFHGISLPEIIKEKRQHDEKGTFLWGYGGNTCHPITQVQPFGQLAASNGHKLYLLMIETKSPFNAHRNYATHYSVDKVNWLEVSSHFHPNAVSGSRYALVCENFVDADLKINLNDYEVGIGKSKGAKVTGYMIKRVDKVCAVYKPGGNDVVEGHVIGVTEIIEPYSVLLKYS